MKPAFIIIDMQKAFYQEANVGPTMDQAARWINASIPLFRKKGLPVIWVQHVDKDEGVVPNTDGFHIIDQLKPLKTDKKIHKTYNNSFNKTDLKKYLDENSVDMVVLAGFSAEFCVMSTARGALDLDLTAVILRGSLASGQSENIPFVENTNQNLSYGVLQKILKDL